MAYRHRGLDLGAEDSSSRLLRSVRQQVIFIYDDSVRLLILTQLFEYILLYRSEHLHAVFNLSLSFHVQVNKL